MKLKLELKKREIEKGKFYIAPFINDWNVWDIPEKYWCQAVEQAILYAYKLGFNQCKDEMNKINLDIPITNLRFKPKE